MSLYKSEKKPLPIEAHRPSLSKQELESVLDCLIEDRLGSGEVVRRFERVFANMLGQRHALAVHSLNSAYHLAFLALGMETDDRLVLSALAPVAAADAARSVGAELVLLDTDRRSYHPSPAAAQERLESLRQDSQKRLFFLLDHSFGSVFEIDADALKKEGILVVEDITSLVGMRENPEGDYFGKRGHLSVCGLAEYDLLTTGNGAMIFSDDTKLAKELKAMRYGEKRRKGKLAWDYRLGDFQAAMGLDQLARLGAMLERRQKIGRKFLEALRSTKHESYYKNPETDTYLNFPVLFSRSSDEVFRYYASLQIGVERASSEPLHQLLDLPRLEYPNAERFYQRAVSIPSYPALTANNVERIAASLRGLI